MKLVGCLEWRSWKIWGNLRGCFCKLDSLGSKEKESKILRTENENMEKQAIVVVRPRACGVGDGLELGRYSHSVLELWLRYIAWRRAPTWSRGGWLDDDMWSLNRCHLHVEPRRKKTEAGGASVRASPMYYSKFYFKMV